MSLTRRLLLFTLFFIFFLDSCGIVIVFILFSSLVIPESSLFLPSDLPLATRNLILGFLYAAYPLTQFIGAPLLGAFSDRLGRKPVLIVSTFATAIFFWMGALAIAWHHLLLLFFSRLLGGLFAGNCTIAQAAIADFVEASQRGRYMAGFAIVGGLAWIIGPFIGSFLSESTLVAWFSPALPFWLMGGGFLLSCLLLLLWTGKEEIKSRTIALSKIVSDFLRVFNMPQVVSLLMLSLISVFGWLMNEIYLAPYLLERFHKTEIEIGVFFAWFAVWWCLGGIVANQWLLKKYQPERVNIAPLFIVGLAVMSIPLIVHPSGVWVATLFSNFSQPITVACFFGIFSKRILPEEQGKVFGLWSAGFALASALAPPLCGWLSQFHLTLPFIVSSVIILSSVCFYMRSHAAS